MSVVGEKPNNDTLMLKPGHVKNKDQPRRRKSISNKAESIQREIEYDLIDFCSSKGKNMSKILVLLKLQEQGVRIQPL